MNKYKIASLLVLLSILLSCDKYDLVRVNTHDPKSPNYKADPPELTTTTASAITSSTALMGGKITSDGGASVTARGVVWSTTNNPVVTLTTKTQDGTGTGTFVSSLTGLASNTNYYARAYATNSSGTGYGSVVTFRTLVVLVPPSLTTTAVTSIGLTKAVSGGNISSDGGASVTARGVCWSTTADPTVALTTKTTDSLGVGIFTSKLSVLTAGTTYHVRAYATNSVSTSYGSDLTFTTLTVAAVPTITTTAVAGIAMTTAVGGGNITFDGGADVTARGVCWSTTADPTVALTSKTSDGTGTGTFSSNITGLTAGTTYHIRAYATNSSGTGYGNDLTFTTSAVAVVPTLTTDAISNLTNTSLTSGGNVLTDGDSPVTARGVCWSTTANPTVSLTTKTIDGNGTGVFTSSVTNLTANTLYHIRAYATNGVGTAYGQDITVTTKATASVPSVTTTSVSGITFTLAISGGNITSDGGATVSARGVCWSTSANPTVPSATRTFDGSGTGIFTSNITGLTAGTTYHVRAYATNSAGTAYGTDLTFLTQAAVVPTITTNAVTNATGTSASSGGNITSDGGATVSLRGICWGTTLNPTIADSKTENGTGTGSFTSNITGLTMGTSYHLRAYATNSVGTAYGQDILFTTPVLATLTTTEATSITIITANGGGTITSDGGATVTERGICWSKSPNIPTTDSTKASSGTGTGLFMIGMTKLEGSTTYNVRAYAINSAGTSYGNNISFITSPPLVPTLTTTEVLSVTLTTASSGGNITDNGGGKVTARGVCWSTTTSPTVALAKTTDGTGSGIFSSAISLLSANTVYYVRAYATNMTGTGYGPEVLFKTSYSTLPDADGNSYFTVVIGTQIWTRENLKTTKYRDGTPIPNVSDNNTWSSLPTGAYCWDNNDIANKNIYGALYNWIAITDSKGLCPTGWHVPTDGEWTTLTTYLGGTSVAGGKLKEAGNTHWYSNSGATNESGFTALPGGYRYSSGGYSYPGSYGYWWSATENISNVTNGYYRLIYYYNASIYGSDISKASGLSVRCIKDPK
jgi:uncharacterized protein (TIGR02145 family)